MLAQNPMLCVAFIKIKSLTQDTVNFVRQLFHSSGILTLPTDDAIKGWQQGFDGITYFVEYSTTDNYSFKSYWTPKAQDSLIEAIQVQRFVDSVFSLVDAGEIWKSFVKTIPYESYYNGGPSVAIRALTNAERKKYARERKLPPTKVFAKAGQDNVTSAICKHQQRFGLTSFNLAFSC